MPLSVSSEQPNSDRTHSRAVKALVIPLVNSSFSNDELRCPTISSEKKTYIMLQYLQRKPNVSNCSQFIISGLSKIPRMMFNLLAPPVLAGLAIHLAAARTNHGVMALLVEGDGWVMKVMK